MKIGWVLAMGLALPGVGQEFRRVAEEVPEPPREFRGAWVAVVHNIDWPSAKGLSAERQQEELRRILDRMASLRMNAVLLQVRPHADAVYESPREPWSHWLSGTMGRSPGYDPLAFCIEEAHRRGIEVHAWFNPFRALSNASHGASADHVTRAAPEITKRYGNLVWCDPGAEATRARALAAILDVVRRYEVDGVHLDDYFYPYPTGGREFPDGRDPAQRREIIDGFVQRLYGEVKQAKPWVRVGISPFGIWRPGVPAGIEAGLDAYEDLGCDARKWLAEGWVDYLAPQLYWRDQPRKQSFSALLEWWRGQGDRPVWPGIASARVASREDPGRPAGEIARQVELSRTIGRDSRGHIHWNASALVDDRGGVSRLLAREAYGEAAVVPAMPWLRRAAVAPPRVAAELAEGRVRVRWQAADAATARYAVMGRTGRSWRLLRVAPASAGGVELAARDGGLPQAVAVRALDRFGNLSSPVVLAR